MNWDLLDWSIIGPALAAGLLVLSTHVPLGQVVLQRGPDGLHLRVDDGGRVAVVAGQLLVTIEAGGTVVQQRAQRRRKLEVALARGRCGHL